MVSQGWSGTLILGLAVFDTHLQEKVNTALAAAEGDQPSATGPDGLPCQCEGEERRAGTGSGGKKKQMPAVWIREARNVPLVPL